MMSIDLVPKTATLRTMSSTKDARASVTGKNGCHLVRKPPVYCVISGCISLLLSRLLKFPNPCYPYGPGNLGSLSCNNEMLNSTNRVLKSKN